MENRYLLPVEDINDDKATIVRLAFQNGEYVQKGDVIYEFETTKALVEVDAEHEGYIFYAVREADTPSTGQLVCVITDQADYRFEQPETEEEDRPYTLTKKALALVEQHDIDLGMLNLSGIVRQKDLWQAISNGKKPPAERILFLDRESERVKFAMEDEQFPFLPSEEKIHLYREAGHEIGKGCIIGRGAVLIGNRIVLGDNVSIAGGTYIESPEIRLDHDVRIGSQGNLVASRLQIGAHTRIGDRVIIDISGGRNIDSDFVCGVDCLVASDCYVNVCHRVELGDHVALSPRSMIFTHSYWQSVLDGYSAQFGPVSMANDSWLGANAQVLPKISIGEGAIVMSGSILTTSVKRHTFVGGNPAKEIKSAIKKSLTAAQKMNILEELFALFSTHLCHHGHEARLDNPRTIRLGNIPDITHIMLSEKVEPGPATSISLALEFGEATLDESFETYVVEEQCRVGSPSSVGRLLTEFLRRRGISFYKKAHDQANPVYSAAS